MLFAPEASPSMPLVVSPNVKAILPAVDGIEHLTAAAHGDGNVIPVA